MKYTLKELDRMRREALSALCRYSGSPSHLSRMIDIPVTTVQGWIQRGRISVNGAKKVSDHPTLGKEFDMKRLRVDLTEQKDYR